jgi:hypothetical protein
LKLFALLQIEKMAEMLKFLYFFPLEKKVAMFGVPLHRVKEEWQKKRNFLLMRKLPLDFRSTSKRHMFVW